MVFNHSVKVPMQYRRATAIFKRAATEKKSLKSLIFEERHAKIPNLLALLNKYSYNKGAIEAAIEGSKILSENKRLDPNLCRVLVTELLFGAKKLNGESKPVACVRSYAEKLREFIEIETDVISAEPANKPRYVRINTNLISLKDAFEFLDEEEWRRVEKTFESYDEYLQNIKDLAEDQYLVDIHIPDLLVFHSKQKSYWACHEYVKETKFILQDKATCIVGQFLNPPKNSTIMDMCAAPGMKTIHLSNIINNEGTIYAIERDEQRYRVLNEMVKKAHATSVQPIHCDALLADREKFPDVEYVLVDPSCSGSGMQNRISLTSGNVNEEERLKKLSHLQVKLLTHAMTEFPNVKRVVYSTCSLSEEENENVVKKSLRKCVNFKLLNGKKLLQRKWNNVGNNTYEGIGKNCIYARPDLDYTNGLFIAVFARINSKE